MVAPNEAYWICAQTGVNPKAEEKPGMGKSKGVYAFARAVGRKVYTLIGSLRDPADIGGYPSLDTASAASVMKVAPPEWAFQIVQSKTPYILFIDELTTCAPAVQAALLRVMAEKVVGDLQLPENLWILSACNPPECAANGVDIEPPMANRLYHHKWQLDTKLVLDGYTNGLQFSVPAFPVLPNDWQKHIPGVGGLVAAFHKVNPGRLAAFPEERAAQCGAWPSPRSWEYAIRCLAAAQSVKAEQCIERELLDGLVGTAVSGEFCTWRDNLDLPDPEVLLAEAMAAIREDRPMVYNHPDRPDKVLAMLASVTQAVTINNTKDRWLGGAAVMDAAGKYDFEAAVAGVAPLFRVSNGHAPSPDFVKKWLPRLQTALGG